MRWIAMALLAVLPLGCSSTAPADKPVAKAEPEPAAPKEIHAAEPPPAASSGGNAAGDPGPGDTPLPGLPEVVAEMEGRKITRDEFLRDAVDWFGRETLEEIILRYVFECAVRDTGASVTDKEMDARVEVEIKNREKKMKADGEPPLAEMLKQMGKTVDQLRAEYRSNGTLQRQVLMEHMFAYSCLTEPSVSVSLIFVRDQAHAERIQKQLKGGKDAPDFGKVAEAESEDEATRANGGRLRQPFILGMGPAGQAFEDAAFALTEEHSLSPVVASNDGFFIIKLNKKNPASPQTFESLRDRINQGVPMDGQTLGRFMRCLRARYVKGLKYAVPDLEPKKK